MTSPDPRSSRLLTALLIGFASLWAASLVHAKTPPGQAKKYPSATSTMVATAYSGQATALRIEDVEIPVSGPIVLADTGPLPATGGLLEASEEDYLLMGADGVTVALGVELAYAITAGSGVEATSDTTLSGFQVRFDSHYGRRVTITADYIAAAASARCTEGGASASGSITVENLRVDGVLINVTGEPNQRVEITDGHIIFNEQTVLVGGGEADIVITAMHVYMDECMNGAFGTVKAGITCGTNPPPPHEESDCGKLTGGGWIVTPSGAKGTFGVSGGIRRGEFWGHLNFNDHGAGLKVRSTAVTGFEVEPGDPDCRIISYNVLINGLPGTAVVEACDHGEPGRDDTFSIRLSTGYAAGGSLGGDGSGGGNIQLHKCPPGWER